MVLRESRSQDTKKWLGQPLVFEEAENLIYLKAALAETLCLYPLVPGDFKHVIQCDGLPDGTFVPAGSTMTDSIYSVGRMETVWGEACMEFRPEMWWISPQGDRATDLLGGKDLAYLQMKSVASAVLLCYRLSPVPGHWVEQKMSLALFMKNDFRLQLLKVTLGHSKELYVYHVYIPYQWI
ncbi:hypothetical protein GQ457_12G028140 [Hibiscus cannabinus]